MFMFAIADLHGRLDMLQAAYRAITAREDAKNGTIIHLGDYIDRGPSSRQVIQFLMNPKTIPEGMRRICLKGNHEAMMVETLTRPLRLDWWLGNGGKQTLKSYTDRDTRDWSVPDHHLTWMAELPIFHAHAGYIFVHAYINPDLPLQSQSEESMLWNLYPNRDERGWRGCHVVHGHHQHAEGPLLFSGRTNLDTYAWKTGRLVVGVFDSEKTSGPVDLIEIIGRKG